MSRGGGGGEEHQEFRDAKVGYGRKKIVLRPLSQMCKNAKRKLHLAFPSNCHFQNRLLHSSSQGSIIIFMCYPHNLHFQPPSLLFILFISFSIIILFTVILYLVWLSCLVLGKSLVTMVLGMHTDIFY